jgi:flagellar protein FlgJ
MDTLPAANSKGLYIDAKNNAVATAVSQNKTSNATNSNEGLNFSKYTQAKKANDGLRDFQGLMVGMMLSSMRSTIQKNDGFNGGQGEEIFQDMLDQEYSKKMASSNMLNMDHALRKSFKLPLNESFQWEQVEKIPEEKLENIYQQLKDVHRTGDIQKSAKEPIAATVSKKLDDVVKSKDLLEKLPEELVKKLDPEFLKTWKEKRELYLQEKGIDDGFGPGMKKMNKELLQTIFGELQFSEQQPSMGQKRKASEAYLKTLTVAK